MSVSPGWFDLERRATRPSALRRGLSDGRSPAVHAPKTTTATSSPFARPSSRCAWFRIASFRSHGGSRRAVHRQPSPRVTRSHSAAVYWRRRLVATALGLGIVLTAAHAGAALGGTTTTAPERSPHVTTVVVQPGDTLWSIAHRLAPNADPRAVVDALAASHGGADRAARRGDHVVRRDGRRDAPVLRGSLVGARAVSARAISWGDVASVRSSSGARPLRVRSRRDPRSPCTPTRSADTRRDRGRVAARAR